MARKLDIWESASSTASLEIALIGTVIAVPMIIFYTAFIYKILYGKSQPLS
jgi:cytochrome d ubiquinol oxidase subunit II|tara:strand:- start:796 stop:948 length:153 start_codon:yes stop_codon:yes gene_type:complete